MGLPDIVMVTIINQMPTSNQPADIITYANETNNITWFLYDDFNPGQYRVWTNDSNDNYYIWSDWTAWTNNTNINVQINRTIPGVYNYTIEFNDTYSLMGIPDTVIVTIINQVPTSNQPSDIITCIGVLKTINWFLYDDYNSSHYRVWVNDSNDNYYIWRNWTLWNNDTLVNININVTTAGVYNYTIEFNDTYNLFGSDTVIVTIVQNNNGQKIPLTAGFNPNIYQFDQYGFLWVNLSIWVSSDTNITITTNLTKPATFQYFTKGNVSIYYQITLQNASALLNVTIRFHYNESILNGTTENNIAIYVWNSLTISWEMLNFKINIIGNYTEVTLYQLSQFVLAPKLPEEEGLMLFPPPAAENQLFLYIIIGGISAVAAIAIGIGVSRRKKPTPKPKKIPKISKEELIVKRAYDYIGGNIRYKVVVENATNENIKDILVELSMKKGFEEINPKNKIKVLEPGESIGSDFILTPLTCGKTRIHGTVQYRNIKDELTSMEITPSVVQIKCPLVMPKEMELSDLLDLMDKLQKSHTEINYAGLNRSVAYQIAKEQISSLDVTEVEENADICHIVYSGEAKVGGDVIIINLNVDEKNIIIDVYLKDVKQATGFLAYIKNLINLAIKYSAKISTTMDAITSKIYNAFEFAQRLSELNNLCLEKASIDDILLVLKELNIKSNSYFAGLKITQIFTSMFNNWITELDKIKEEKIWERTYINLQYDILSWMDAIIILSETNSKTYFENPDADDQTKKNIEAGNSQLRQQLSQMNREYSRNILFALMLINKVSGLSMYNHNFKPEKGLDSDLIGGFLTAIQSFGMELGAEAKETGMQKLSYQHFEIGLQEGKYTMAALITSGMPNQLTIERQKEILIKFEKEFEVDLEKFVGDVSIFNEAEKLVNEIFLKK